MPIASANLRTRNVYREYIRPACSAAQEAQMAKLVPLIVKFGALAFVILLPLQYAIELQLLGGVWISQTLPAVIGGLFTRWFHDRALVAGWLAGIKAPGPAGASRNPRGGRHGARLPRAATRCPTDWRRSASR